MKSSGSGFRMVNSCNANGSTCIELLKAYAHYSSLLSIFNNAGNRPDSTFVVGERVSDIQEPTATPPEKIYSY